MVCVCVCDVSHGTRLTQHPLASHNNPFESSVPGPSPCPAAGTPNRILGKGRREGREGQRASIRPGSRSVARRQHTLDPAHKSHPPCFLSAQCYSYREGGEGKTTSLGEPWFPPPLPPTCFLDHKAQSAGAEPNSIHSGIVHAGSRGWLGCCAYVRLIANPLLGHVHGPWDSSRKPALADGMEAELFSGTAWGGQITGSQSTQGPVPWICLIDIAAEARRGVGGSLAF